MAPHKRFFIRKTQGELIQEQTKLIEDFLNNQQQRTVEQEYVVERKKMAAPKSERMIYEEKIEEDDVQYIPSISKASVSLSLNTSKTKIEDDDVQKLRKIRADATKLV